MAVGCWWRWKATSDYVKPFYYLLEDASLGRLADLRLADLRLVSCGS